MIHYVSISVGFCIVSPGHLNSTNRWQCLQTCQVRSRPEPLECNRPNFWIYQKTCFFFDVWPLILGHWHTVRIAQGGTCFSCRKFKHRSAFVRVHRRRADIGSVNGSLVAGEEHVGVNSIGGRHTVVVGTPRNQRR